jgi:SAM-dependent methyltransferase
MKHPTTDEDRFVQLGAFDTPFPGWYNTDITPHLLIARIPFLSWIMEKCHLISLQKYQLYRKGIFKQLHFLDLRKRFPFENDSIKAFYSSHTLEHIYVYETKRVLLEIYRTLKPGGWVRIALPDLEFGMKLYKMEDPTAFLSFLFENEHQNMKKNQHKWMYTAPYLIRLLKEVGFLKPQRRQFQQTDFPPFENKDNRPEKSFYIEAQKK